MAKVKYGFIIPGTTYFLAIGQPAGLHSGIGYKITQDNGNVCDGLLPTAETMFIIIIGYLT